MIYLLTGSIGSGKTTSLLNYCMSHHDVKGILSPEIEGRRHFMDIESGSIMEMETNEEDAFMIGRFKFSKKSFEWAINKITSAMDAELLVIDEIGPLELRGEGFAAMLKQVIEADVNLLIVVRESLVKEVIDYFHLKNVKIIKSVEQI